MFNDKCSMINDWRSPIWAIVLFLIMPGQLAHGETNLLAQNDSSCDQDLQQLTSSLLQDLPSYSNRVIQRTQTANRQAGIRNFIVTASQPEFEPLNLPRLQYNQIDDRNPEQVFFTVLERQYNNNQITTIQTFHWLFLTQTDNGWRTVMMFSRFGNSKNSKPPAPPRETTDGIIGQGVQLWLKDCRAGRIK